MTGPTGKEAGRVRLLRAQRALFVELGRRIFRLRPRDPSAARGALAVIGRRAFHAGWSRDHPDLLPLHERLLEIEAELARAKPEKPEGRRGRGGDEMAPTARGRTGARGSSVSWSKNEEGGKGNG